MTPAASRDHDVAARAAAFAAVVAALLVRLWHLGARSVWTDEGTVWTAASASLTELVRFCAQEDASPPFFHLLTWTALRFGDSETHLRIVSALASVALVWMTYRLARLGAPRGTAAFAAWIVALSPYQLMYAQEARTYMLVACLATLSSVLFVRIVLLGARGLWPAYVVAVALALYTQSIAVLAFVVQGAFVVFTSPGRRRLVPWLGAMAVAALCYLPWLLVSAAQESGLSHSHWYLESPDSRGVFQVLRAVFLSPIPLVTSAAGTPWPGLDAVMPRSLAHLLLLAVPALPLAFALPQARAAGTRGAIARFALVGLVLPLAMVLAVSQRVPLWLPRYFVLLTPMLAVLLAFGLSALRPRALARVWAALFLIVSAYACVRYDMDYTKERWRDVVSYIERHRVPEDPATAYPESAVLVTFDDDPFRFYASKRPTSPAVFEFGHPAVPFASDYTRAQLDTMEATARARTRDADEVWVVVRSPNSEVRREAARRALRVAAAGREGVSRLVWRSTGGPLRVSRYRKAAR